MNAAALQACRLCGHTWPEGEADVPLEGATGAKPPFDMGIVSIEVEWLAALMAQVADLLERSDERSIRRARCIAEAAEQLAQSLCDRAGELS